MRSRFACRAIAVASGLALIGLGATSRVSRAQFAPPPSPSDSTVMPWLRSGAAMANADGDCVCLDTLVLQTNDAEIAPSWTGIPNSVRRVYVRGRKSYRPTGLTYSYRTAHRMVTLFRPVTNVLVDSSRTAASILDEYFHDPSCCTFPASESDPNCQWYKGSRTCWWLIDVPDTGSTPYLIAWIAVRGFPSERRAPQERDSSDVIGAVIVDPVHNRLIWRKGGRYQR